MAEIRSKGFILYEEDEELFDELDGEETKALIKACFAYHNRGEDLTGTMNGFARRAFKLIKRNMVRDMTKYVATREKRQAGLDKANRRKRESANDKDTLTSRYADDKDTLTSQTQTKTKTKAEVKAEAQAEALTETKDNNKPGIELSPPGDRLSSKPSDKPSDEEIAALQNRFMNKRRNRQSSEDREEHLRSVGFYEMTAAEKIAYLEEERRRKKHANS